MRIILYALQPSFGRRWKEAQYIGGTFTGLKEKAEAVLVTTDDTWLRFDAKKDARSKFPYGLINSLEYGQKAWRRRRGDHGVGKEIEYQDQDARKSGLGGK